MKTPCPPSSHTCGSSLIEVLLAMGVLAVALPLVGAVLVRAGQSAAAAQAETRCGWIVPACMKEIEAAYEGKARFLPKLPRNQPFPAAGEVLALAFAGDGRALGRIDRETYHSGGRILADEPIRYLASIHAAPAASRSNITPMLGLRVTLEYPSAAPLAKRRKLDFHTCIP
jgi:hypothetical protein